MKRLIKALYVMMGVLCILNLFVPRIVRGSENDEGAEKVKAVWAATVFSLDYPSRPTTDDVALKKDIDDMIDTVCSMGYNTLFFQVRPAADAFYKSEIFPMSPYLTGIQGVSPENSFDPLEYAVDVAHKRGIKLHAWINPYRVTASGAETEKQTENSIANKYPELVVKHSDGKLYLNPGIPMTNDIVVEGALEIVRNYDVDGLHIDDYFYPDSSFPDSKAYEDYGYGFSDIEDWRRNNITELITRLHNELKSERDDIIFSVSPCGIWANAETVPGGSATKGKQAFSDYYADTRLWVTENLVDWMMPQIYWNTGFETADFEILANWWNDAAEGTDVKICIGQAVYKAADAQAGDAVWYGENGADELRKQNSLIDKLKNVNGYSHYRLGSLKKSSILSNYAEALNNNIKTSTFSDTEAYPWAEEAVENLYKNGIVNGMGDGTFGCARLVSRADFMLMLVRMMGKEVDFTENFADVSEDKYYYREIGIAKELGFTNGRDGVIFDPAGNISRQDMAVMVYRVLISEGEIAEGNPELLKEYFSDSESISGYAREAVAAMRRGNFLSGYETGEFRPQGEATRAETAVFLDKIMNTN